MTAEIHRSALPRLGAGDMGDGWGCRDPDGRAYGRKIMTKLEWTYQSTSNGALEYHTIVERGSQTYRIRAVYDECGPNPFEDGDCNWPIIVRSPDSFNRFVTYERGVEGTEFRMGDVLDTLTDAALVHNQIHIAQVLGTTVKDMLEELDGYDDSPQPRYHHDARILRDAFDNLLEEVADSDKLGIAARILEIADVPHYHTTVRGYSQGDWSDVLVFAPASERKRLGVDEVNPKDLELTAKLYGWWAYGDVYGFVVEKRTGIGASIFLDEGGPQELFIANFEDVEAAEDFLATSATIDPKLLAGGNYSVVDYEDPDASPWEEIDSCWGYYGPDFAESGLEADALGSVPEIRQVA